MTPRHTGTAPGRVWARFDDLQAGTALRCPTPDRVLVADRVWDVADVLEQVQQATDAGRWAFGNTQWKPTDETSTQFVSSDGKWTRTRADLVFGSNSELSTPGPGGGLRKRRRTRKVRQRLHRRLEQSHRPRQVRPALIRPPS